MLIISLNLENSFLSTCSILSYLFRCYFCEIEKNYENPMSEDEIYNLLKGFKYIVPQGSPMSGIGNTHQFQSLSNCFVVDSPRDSYGGILKTDQEQVQIMKRRGGVGFDISSIFSNSFTR